jgi:hypothetical protein
MSPAGLAVATRAFQDVDTRLSLREGDTLIILNNEGEGFLNARLRDSAVQVTVWSIDSAGTNGLRLIRAPGEYWWAHFIVSDSLRGWVLMESVEVLGADACGS